MDDVDSALQRVQLGDSEATQDETRGLSGRHGWQTDIGETVLCLARLSQRRGGQLKRGLAARHWWFRSFFPVSFQLFLIRTSFGPVLLLTGITWVGEWGRKRFAATARITFGCPYGVAYTFRHICVPVPQ